MAMSAALGSITRYAVTGCAAAIARSIWASVRRGCELDAMLTGAPSPSRGQCGHTSGSCALFTILPDHCYFPAVSGLAEAVETKWINRVVDGAVRLRKPGEDRFPLCGLD